MGSLGLILGTAQNHFKELCSLCRIRHRKHRVLNIHQNWIWKRSIFSCLLIILIFFFSIWIRMNLVLSFLHPEIVKNRNSQGQANSGLAKDIYFYPSGTRDLHLNFLHPRIPQTLIYMLTHSFWPEILLLSTLVCTFLWKMLVYLRISIAQWKII